MVEIAAAVAGGSEVATEVATVQEATIAETAVVEVTTTDVTSGIVKEIGVDAVQQMPAEIVENCTVESMPKEIVDNTGKDVGKHFDSSLEGNYENKYEYIKTRNESLEGCKHPITGVPFVRKIIELPNGNIIEGVFAEFEALFEAYIPEDMFLKADRLQFKECNKQLIDEIERNLELKNKFTPEQLEQIKDGVYDGTAPEGYVWNHDAVAGKIQLVDFETHQKTGHTGGREIWGGGSEYR